MGKPEELQIFRPYQIEGLRRMGNKYDGGYVIHYPSLRNVDCLVTYGVGYNVKFEEAFQAETGKPVYAFDPTLMKVKYLWQDIKQGLYAHSVLQAANWLKWIGKEKKLEKKQIHLIQEGLANTNSEKFKTLDYHLSKYNLLDKKIFLKIDIEAAEYGIMNEESFYKHFDNVIQMVYEFHWLDSQLEKLLDIMKKIARTHSLIHIHANNFGSFFDYHGKQVPHVIEVTFLHNSLMPEKKLSAATYPIEGLDAPCTPRRKELIPDFF